jgi:hypothetical protein
MDALDDDIAGWHTRGPAMRSAVSLQDNLHRLVALSAPYWAGEGEVVRTYFQGPARSTETDLLWLRRQCFKEMWGSGVGDRAKGLFQWRVAYLTDVFERIDRGVDRHEVLEVIEDLKTEFVHYCVFADVHDFLSGSKLNPTQLAGWPADDELARIRYAYRHRYGVLGDLAVEATEGGYGAMYSAGMQLRGTGELNDRIARACEQVYRDEIGHARRGLVGLAHREPAVREWEDVAQMITTILRQRLHMRNEQFSFPVSAERMQVLEAGKTEPAEFDYSDLV